MSKKIIAWDLGTGGNKASLYNVEGHCLAETFIPYETTYPSHGWHEQKPEDWWYAVVESTKQLLKNSKVNKEDIACCGISGHSLGAVPLDKDGNLLRESTPIWSDGRATEQAKEFFSRFSEEEWYSITGNGFSSYLYSVFKVMWYRDVETEMYEKIAKVVGTKDYINYKLTGRIVTDPSYASGSGVYDLLKWDYSEQLIAAFDLLPGIFPEIVPSTDVIGEIREDVAEELGLGKHVSVVAGGVDNSCMALGAKAFKEGRIYNSLGSSSWIAVSSSKPLIDSRSKPYVFTHVVPGMFASALCIASGGSSYKWVMNQFAKDLQIISKQDNLNIYDLLTMEAGKSSIGAKKLIFNPSMGGGMPMDISTNIRGAFIGLDLGHTRADILRATMEGITLGLRLCLDELRLLTTLSEEMLLVGGGSRDPVWRQIYADCYQIKILKSNIDQQAAALGAAALAAVGTGLWCDFEKIDHIHIIEEFVEPILENVKKYDELLTVFIKAGQYLSELGDMTTSLTV